MKDVATQLSPPVRLPKGCSFCMCGSHPGAIPGCPACLRETLLVTNGAPDSVSVEMMVRLWRYVQFASATIARAQPIKGWAPRGWPEWRGG